MVRGQRPGLMKTQKCHVAEPPLSDSLCPPACQEVASVGGRAEAEESTPPTRCLATGRQEVQAGRAGSRGLCPPGASPRAAGVRGGGRLSRQPAHPSLWAKMPGGSGIIQTRCPPTLLLGLGARDGPTQAP